jgi:hypothetical protein
MIVLIILTLLSSLVLGILVGPEIAILFFVTVNVAVYTAGLGAYIVRASQCEKIIDAFYNLNGLKLDHSEIRVFRRGPFSFKSSHVQVAYVARCSTAGGYNESWFLFGNYFFGLMFKTFRVSGLNGHNGKYSYNLLNGEYRITKQSSRPRTHRPKKQASMRARAG